MRGVQQRPRTRNLRVSNRRQRRQQHLLDVKVRSRKAVQHRNHRVAAAGIRQLGGVIQVESKVGKGTLVMVGVVLDRSTPESFASFEQAVAKLKCVLDCHLVAGDFDYFLKIRAGDVDDFKRIHGDHLIALPGVRQTRTFFVMKEVVDNAPLEF